MATMATMADQRGAVKGVACGMAEALRRGLRANVLWTLQWLTLVVMTVWAAMDPVFEEIVQSRSGAAMASEAGWFRVASFVLLLAVAAVSFVSLVAKSVGGRGSAARYRSISQLLAITGMFAVWCSLAIHHESIAWQGKRIRFANRIDRLEEIAAPLRQDWPQRDGTLERIGPFMAYPFGRPTTLILLQAPRITSQSVYVSAIERSGDGAIKLQLTGTDGGVWAQWHPRGSVPRSFTGGLAEHYEIHSASEIGGGWFLVRYH